MALPRTDRLTLEQYLTLPEEKPYREYVAGKAVPKPMTDRNHILLVSRIIVAIYDYITRHGGQAGPEGSVLFDDPADRRVLLPDVAYWAPGRPMGAFPMSRPTLAVEVRSPSQSLSEQRAKCRYYLGHGVDVAWLVDPNSRTIEIFEKVGERTITEAGVLSATALPGFHLKLADLFQVVDPE